MFRFVSLAESDSKDGWVMYSRTLLGLDVFPRWEDSGFDGSHQPGDVAGGRCGVALRTVAARQITVPVGEAGADPGEAGGWRWAVAVGPRVRGWVGGAWRAWR